MSNAATFLAMAEAMGGFQNYVSVKSTPSPIYFPKKHTKESYRSQQRAKKAMGKNRKKK